MLIWSLIGIFCGFFLGVTTLDVGLLCVPLIALLVDSVSWTDAATYSLVVVALGALLGWIPRRRDTHTSTVVQISVFSLSGSLIVGRLKLSLPSFIFAFVFAAAAFLTVIFWYRDFRTRKQSALAVVRNREPVRFQEWFTSLAGIGFGSLVTVSGLSGYFFVFPYLVKTLRLNRATATATAYCSIFLGATGSLLVQSRMFAFTPRVIDLLFFLLGAVVAWVGARVLVKNFLNSGKN